MKRVKKNPDGDPGSQMDPDDILLKDLYWKCGSGFSSVRLMGVLLVALMVVSVLFSVSVVLRDPPDDRVGESNEARVFKVKSERGTCFMVFNGSSCILFSRVATNGFLSSSLHDSFVSVFVFW